jgi:hypothetical protein
MASNVISTLEWVDFSALITKYPNEQSANNAQRSKMDIVPMINEANVTNIVIEATI